MMVDQVQQVCQQVNLCFRKEAEEQHEERNR